MCRIVVPAIPAVIRLAVNRAVLNRHHVIKPRRRTIRRRIPVCGAPHRRATSRSPASVVSFAGSSSGLHVFGSMPLAQFSLSTIFVASKRLAGGPVQHVQKAIAVRMQQQLAVLSLPLCRPPEPAAGSRPSHADRAACTGSTTAACPSSHPAPGRCLCRGCPPARLIAVRIWDADCPPASKQSPRPRRRCTGRPGRARRPGASASPFHVVGNRPRYLPALESS